MSPYMDQGTDALQGSDLLVNGHHDTSKPANGASAKDDKKTSALHHRSGRKPLIITSTKERYLNVEDTYQLFDATGGAAVSCLGHSVEFNERVIEAYSNQLRKVAYCHTTSFTTTPAESLAAVLRERSSGKMVQMQFHSSGSGEVEAAMKLATQYHLEKKPSEPQRDIFISRYGSYHGATTGALCLSGHAARREGFEALLGIKTKFVSACNAYRGKRAGESDDAYVIRLLKEIEAAILEVGSDKVIAFIAEPVVGAALGCVPSVPGYFKGVRALCDKYDIVMILDEVMCGSGRIGPRPTKAFPRPLMAWQDPSVGVTPDIVVMGKSLNAGFCPLSAMLMTSKVAKVLEQGSGGFRHGQTFQDYPAGCAAALEVLRIIDEHDLVANVSKQGALLGRLLKDLLEHHPHVGNVRGHGLFWGIEFVKDKVTKQPFQGDGKVASAIVDLGEAEPHRITLYPGAGSAGGKAGDHILLAPAYNVTGEDIHFIANTTAGVIEDYFKRNSDLP